MAQVGAFLDAATLTLRMKVFRDHAVRRAPDPAAKLITGPRLEKRGPSCRRTAATESAAWISRALGGRLPARPGRRGLQQAGHRRRLALLRATSQLRRRGALPRRQRGVGRRAQCAHRRIRRRARAHGPVPDEPRPQRLRALRGGRLEEDPHRRHRIPVGRAPAPGASSRRRTSGRASAAESSPCGPWPLSAGTPGTPPTSISGRISSTSPSRGVLRVGDPASRSSSKRNTFLADGVGNPLL